MFSFGQGVEGQFSGQFEQGILQHLFSGQVGRLGDMVIEPGRSRVKTDEKFFHGSTPYINVPHFMPGGLTGVIK